MKKLLRVLLITLGSLFGLIFSYIIAKYTLAFQSDLTEFFVWAFLILIAIEFLFVLIVAVITAVVYRSNIKQLSHAMNIACSFFLITSICCMSLFGTLALNVDFYHIEGSFRVVDKEQKERALGRTLSKVSGQIYIEHRESTYDNITYYYSPCSTQQVHEFNTFITLNKEKTEELIPSVQNPTRLAIKLLDGPSQAKWILTKMDSSQVGVYSRFEISAYSRTAYRDKLEADSTLLHEYAHYLFHIACLDKNIDMYSLPYWLLEGLSEYYSYNILHSTPAYTADGYDMFYNLDDIKYSQTWAKKGDIVMYETAYSFINYLVMIRGSGVVHDLLTQLTSISNFEIAFFVATGMTVLEAQEFAVEYYDELNYTMKF